MADQSEAANFKLSPISWPSLNASIMKLHSRQSTSAFVGLDWFLFVCFFFVFGIPLDDEESTKRGRASNPLPCVSNSGRRVREDACGHRRPILTRFLSVGQRNFKNKTISRPIVSPPGFVFNSNATYKKKTHTNTLNAGHTHTHTHPPTPTVSSSLSWLTDPPPRKKKKE